MKIYLVDDNTAFRENLKLFLEEHLKHQVVGESVSGKDFLKQTNMYADIILMDINMPEINGLNATKQSTWLHQSLKIIAVSQHIDTVDIQQLISVGFKGFVSKANLFRDLEDAIELVSKGRFFFPSELKVTK